MNVTPTDNVGVDATYVDNTNTLEHISEDLNATKSNLEQPNDQSAHHDLKFQSTVMEEAPLPTNQLLLPSLSAFDFVGPRLHGPSTSDAGSAVSIGPHYLDNSLGAFSIPKREVTSLFSNNVGQRDDKNGVAEDTSLKSSNASTSFPDQFGLAGLAAGIAAAQANPNLGLLAFGSDLHELGIDMEQEGNVFEIFPGPFASQPTNSLNRDWDIPQAYRVNSMIKDKLPPMNQLLNEDTLFFLFYTQIGNAAQKQAFTGLRNQGWSYSSDKKLWFMRVPGENYILNGSVEIGVFCYFDNIEWKKKYEKLEIDIQRLETSAD